MTNWKEYKLGDAIKVKHGFAFKGDFFSQTPTSDVLLTPGNFNIGGGFKADKFKYYNGSYPDSYILKEGDIIVSMTDLSKEGDTLGYSAKIPSHNNIKYLHNQRLGLLQLINNELNLNFIYWLLRTKDYQQFIVSSATGTTVKHTSPTRICEYEFKAPDYTTQTAIAEILSSLDDKIELNNKINQELENLAQTLFKQWFIDFEFPNEKGEPYKSSGGELVESELGEIPKGWVVKKLGELVKKSNTGADAIKRAPIVTEDTGIRCVRVGDMTNKRPFDEWGFCKITPEDYKRYKLEINDIVVTRTATLGINTIIRNEIKGVYNNGLIRLKIDSSKILPLLAYCFFQSDSYKIWIERISGDSSTRPNMQINYLLDFPMYQSPLNIQNRFIEQAEIIFESLESNILENKELTNLKDTLLPKLISGELKVAEVMAEKA